MSQPGKLLLLGVFMPNSQKKDDDAQDMLVILVFLKKSGIKRFTNQSSSKKSLAQAQD